MTVIIDVITSYIKNVPVMHFIACTIADAIIKLIPSFVTSFLSSCTYGFIITTVNKNINIFKKYIKNAPLPWLINIPKDVVIKTGPAGIVLLQAATKKANPNGNSPSFIDTVEIKKDKI